ncbi:glycoside hydrolase family 88 protein [Kiritimatiella glycovorans]|uniref:Glycosyl hydrolase family 88 n=1 Tax=Kiritimatiella glycovorans TaxID=1307763 RepID=A0A0G3EJM8_9BACT|nr:glycoside hydrolase family 88 protein [Kiritimatiella glycovorans]AKJ65652.1 Glycosyl hydrolase family 88 [Kiritimatiella glycovorans]
MRKRIIIVCAGAIGVLSAASHAADAADERDIMEPAAVKAVLKKVADWQLQPENGRHHPLRWMNGALYVGMLEWARIADTYHYFAALRDIGEEHSWSLLPRTYHADDHTVAQMYLELYRIHRDPAMLEPTRSQFDEIIAHPPELDRHRWWWSDALFMSPAVWVKLHAITGDEKYLRFMDQEYAWTTDMLYDEEASLYFRDRNYLYPAHQSENGRKVFWSRGNGWVFGGLVNVLSDLPEDWPTRPKYERIFTDMAASLKRIQQPDGYWRTNLGDPDEYTDPETSGTGFFVYGLAWGINHGYLDRETYLPTVEKGWKALVKAVQPGGRLGFVQPIGAAPTGGLTAQQTEVYGVGAFLAAGSQVFRLLEDPSASPCFARFVPERMDDFAWENDRIAFRMYGPALWNSPGERCGSGIDVWAKRVRYPIINKWYKHGDYHRDLGEGLDFYKVGKTLGCGGLGYWVEDTLVPGDHFASYKVLQGSGDEIAFELHYAPKTIGRATVTEIKRLSMQAGRNLFTAQSTFRVEGADSITAAVGIVLRDDQGRLEHGENWISYAGPETRGKGRIFCGAVLPNRAEFKRADGHALLLQPIRDGDTFTYRAGAAWSHGLDFRTEDEWLTYIKRQAAGSAN